MLKAIRHVSWRLQQDKSNQDTMMSILIPNSTCQAYHVARPLWVGPLPMSKPKKLPRQNLVMVRHEQMRLASSSSYVNPEPDKS